LLEKRLRKAKRERLVQEVEVNTRAFSFR